MCILSNLIILIFSSGFQLDCGVEWAWIRICIGSAFPPTTNLSLLFNSKSSKSPAFTCFLPSRQPCWPSAPSPLELWSSLGRPSHSQRLISSSPFPPSASSWLYGHMSRSCSSPVFGISTSSKGLSSASLVALHPATPVHLSQSQQCHTATVIVSWISQENPASPANCLRSFSARWMSS